MQLVEGVADIEDVGAFVDRLDAIGDDHGVAVQAFDARYVAGRRHLEAAVRCANRAAEREDMIATDRGIEILLYAAGRRQIDRALEIGVDPGEHPIVVVVDGDGEDDAAAEIAELLSSADDPMGVRDEEAIRDFFGITPDEAAATEASLEDLVVERVVLLTVEK